MNVSIINDVDFLYTIIWVVSLGLVVWFMGWGVSFLTSLFIKILKKGV